MIGPSYTASELAEQAVTVQAVEGYVSRLVFLPGWSFATYRYDGTTIVDVVITRAVADTDYPPNYERPLPYPWALSVTIDCESIESLDAVGYAILTGCIGWLLDAEAIEHEAREFFRVHVGTDINNDKGPENWSAPFHPHRHDGSYRWNRQASIE